MDGAKQRAMRFLEKEIKTYQALALFLSKGALAKDRRVREKQGLTPAYYQERMFEATALVSDLKKSR